MHVFFSPTPDDGATLVRLDGGAFAIVSRERTKKKKKRKFELMRERERKGKNRCSTFSFREKKETCQSFLLL